jgi:uncharacterized membrane protein YdjX (TVP38/TMEM64 family)
MPSDAVGLLVLLVSSVVTFTLARVLGKRWRDKRKQKQEAQARASETRQVRRARERKGNAA